MSATPRDRTAWIPWILAGLVVIVWLPSLGASFQFDDWAVVVDDPRVQSVSAWWASMPGMRALLKLSFALNHEWQASAAGFRIVNIGLHAGNTLLVFMLLRDLGVKLARVETYEAISAATIGTLVFALHPVQTESVTYIAGRSNVLMASFSLLAILAWSKRGAMRGWVAVSLSLLFLAAAIATKETSAVLPLAFLLWSVTTRDSPPMKLLPALVPAFLLVILLLGIGLVWMPYMSLLATSLAERGVLANLAVQAQAITWLAGQLLPFAPLNADPALAFDSAPTLLTLAQVVLHVVLILFAVFSLPRRPAIAFGILWFYLWLAPTNSLLARLDAANDRQLYLAIIGPGWLLGLALGWASRQWAANRLYAGSIEVLLLVFVLGADTLLRNRVYQDERSFWQDVAAKSPHNARAANNLGMAYALRCEPLAARAEFERATRIDPEDPRPSINALLLSTGDLPGQPEGARCRE